MTASATTRNSILQGQYSGDKCKEEGLHTGRIHEVFAPTLKLKPTVRLRA